jgi:radical SAM superfamily enzyme YgiQ (UPF0313 family)
MIEYKGGTMKVCLITPPFDIIKEGYGSKVRNKRYGYWPPLGVGYLGASLKAHGHEVEIIDSPPLRYSNKDILERLKESKPDLIGISSLTATKDQAYSLIRYLKKHLLTKAPIILGGPHATTFPMECLQEVAELDAIAIGEGEETILELVKNLEQKKGFEGIRGVYYRDRNNRKKIVKNELRVVEPNLDNILPPAWELYDMNLYQPLPLQYKETPILPYVTSRGCPWKKCTFCFEAGHSGQPYRRHSPQRVIDDLKKMIKNLGLKEVAFWDDNFMINERWVVEFCNLLRKNKIKLYWQAYGRVNTVTEKMLEQASKSGCWNIFYGFESGNQDLLDNIRKGITLEQSMRAAKWTHAHGLETRGSFMLALPGETPSKALNTIRFAIKMDLTFAQFLPTYPEPSTPLYFDALRKGKIVKQPKYKGRTSAVYVPEGYKDSEEVVKMVKKAYRKFYLRPAYMLKHLRRLKSINMARQYWEAFRFIVGIGF